LSTKRLKIDKNEALAVFYSAFSLANIPTQKTFDPQGNEVQVPEQKWNQVLRDAISDTLEKESLPPNYSNYLKDRFNHLLRIANDQTKQEFGCFQDQWKPLLDFSSGKTSSAPLPFYIFFSPKRITRFNLWSEPLFGKILTGKNSFRFESINEVVNCQSPKVIETVFMPRKPLQWIKVSYLQNGKNKVGYFSISDNEGGLKPVTPLEKVISSLAK